MGMQDSNAPLIELQAVTKVYGQGQASMKALAVDVSCRR